MTAPEREMLARALYELDPGYESGEYIDGFQVTPDFDLTWERCLDEYPDKLKTFYAAADHLLSLGWCRREAVLREAATNLLPYLRRNFVDRTSASTKPSLWHTCTVCGFVSAENAENHSAGCAVEQLRQALTPQARKEGE